MLRSALELIRTSQGQNADGTPKFEVVGSTGLGERYKRFDPNTMSNMFLSGLWALKRLGK